MQARKGNTIEMTGDEKVVLEWPNGWTWFDLERSGCSKEADAMGHCGNGSGNYGETILSLRKNVSGDFWTPHLTFILDDNNMLGEMKGRNNDKPVSRYHPYIIALLKSDVVDGIKGGGYMPENNFSMRDLDDDVRKELCKEKPGLAEFHDVLSEWEKAKIKKLPADQLKEIKDIVESKLVTELRKYNVYSYDLDKDEIIISRSRLVYHYDLSVVENFFEDALEEIIIESGPPEITEWQARDIASNVASKYAEEIFDNFMRLDSYNYNFASVQLRRDGDNIETFVSIRDYAYANEEELNYVQELDERRDDDYEPDDLDNMSVSDSVARLIQDFIYNMIRDKPKQNNPIDFVKTLLRELGYDEHVPPSVRGYRSTDPNQLSLDLGDGR
jgi:hypothetical protein